MVAVVGQELIQAALMDAAVEPLLASSRAARNGAMRMLTALLQQAHITNTYVWRCAFAFSISNNFCDLKRRRRHDRCDTAPMYATARRAAPRGDGRCLSEVVFAGMNGDNARENT